MVGVATLSALDVTPPNATVSVPPATATTDSTADVPPPLATTPASVPLAIA